MDSFSHRSEILVVSYKPLSLNGTATDKFHLNKIRAISSNPKRKITLIYARRKDGMEDFGNETFNLKPISTNSKFKPFTHFLVFIYTLIYLIVERKKIEIFYAVGGEFMPLMMFAKKFLGYKTISDIDTYTIAYGNGEIMSAGLYDLVERIFEPLSKFADVCIVINDRDKSMLLEKGFREANMIVMPPSINTVSIDQEAITSMRKQFTKEHKIVEPAFIITFHGSANAPHNKAAIDNIIETILPKVILKHDNAFFLIIGGGYDHDKSTFSSNKDRVYFTGFLSEDQMKNLLLLSDIYIAPMSVGAKGGTKTKIIEAAMHGLPVITTDEVYEQYAQENCPFLISKVEDFDKVIDILMSDNHLLNNVKSTTLNYVVSNYSHKNYEIFSAKIKEILKLTL